METSVDVAGINVAKKFNEFIKTMVGIKDGTMCKLYDQEEVLHYDISKDSTKFEEYCKTFLEDGLIPVTNIDLNLDIGNGVAAILGYCHAPELAEETLMKLSYDSKSISEMVDLVVKTYKAENPIAAKVLSNYIELAGNDPFMLKPIVERNAQFFSSIESVDTYQLLIQNAFTDKLSSIEFLLSEIKELLVTIKNK